MDNKPTPGAPPETVKPDVKGDVRPDFSYLDLQFTDAFISDNRKFVTFFVAGDTPYYVSFLRIEFEEYQRAYFDKFDYNAENELCTCDKCSCQYELIDEEKVTIRIRQEGSEEETEIEETIPIFAVFNPTSSLIVGICDVNKH